MQDIAHWQQAPHTLTWRGSASVLSYTPHTDPVCAELSYEESAPRPQAVAHSGRRAVSQDCVHACASASADGPPWGHAQTCPDRGLEMFC